MSNARVAAAGGLFGLAAMMIFTMPNGPETTLWLRALGFFVVFSASAVAAFGDRKQ